MEYEDLYHRVPWPPRSKVKVTMSHGTSDSRWPINRERNVLETPKLVERLHTPQAITRSSLRLKTKYEDPYRRQAPSPGQLLLRPKLYHIYWTWRLTNFWIVTPVEHALSAFSSSSLIFCFIRGFRQQLTHLYLVAYSTCSLSVAIIYRLPDPSSLKSKIVHFDMHHPVFGTSCFIPSASS